MFALFKIVPLKIVSKLGQWLGTFLASLPASTNQMARYNIRLCFPEKSEKEVREIHEKATQNFIQTLLEMPKVYSLNSNNFKKHVEVEGIEHLRNDTSRLILTAHYGNWDVVNKTIGHYGIPMASIYRKANNPYVNSYITKLRGQDSGLMIEKGIPGAKKLIKAVKEGMCAGFLNDQKMSDGIASTFFGQEVKSPSAIADLALKYNREVVPVFAVRTKLGHFKIKFYPPVKLKKIGESRKDSAHAIQMFNNIIEEQIKEDPTLWLWHHKRFTRKIDQTL
tara:strand:- start:759 stop:1595 length:837 start_codon:yes stop_codon:yes gene_type:complete